MLKNNFDEIKLLSSLIKNHYDYKEKIEENFKLIEYEFKTNFLSKKFIDSKNNIWYICDCIISPQLKGCGVLFLKRINRNFFSRIFYNLFNAKSIDLVNFLDLYITGEFSILLNEENK